MVKSVFSSILLCLCLSARAQDNDSSGKGSKARETEIELDLPKGTKERKVALKWKVKAREGFCVIERSNDLHRFETIGVMKLRSGDSALAFTDENPPEKLNYYRIKLELEGNRRNYSNIVLASGRDSVFCKFYPNPVDKLLIFRSEYAVALKITDLDGRPRLAQRLKPGLQILDVSCLEKSIYLISIFNEESNQFITQKLVKN